MSVQRTGVLSKSRIKEYLSDHANPDRLYVTPLLDEKQIGDASIDVRLGSSIIVPRQSNLGVNDPTQDDWGRGRLESRLYHKIQLQYHSGFVLHPGRMILGVTFEYICLPNDLFGMIVSRSSWGRLGLIIATASVIQPGYKGALTLELANVSENPIALYPGLAVGQLVLADSPASINPSFVNDVAGYGGRYVAATQAELPRFWSDEAKRELRFWGERTGGE